MYRITFIGLFFLQQRGIAIFCLCNVSMYKENTAAYKP